MERTPLNCEANWASATVSRSCWTRLKRACRQGDGLVLALVVAEFGYDFSQFGIGTIGQLIELRRIVPVNLGLDRRSAGHRRLGPDHGGCRAEGKTGKGP